MTRPEPIGTSAHGVAPLGRGLTRAFFEAVLDLLPTPVALLEPGTGNVTFANQAADRLVGGTFPRGPAFERNARYPATDPDGNPIPPDELPGVRAARGERVEGFHLDWHLPNRVASVLVSADTVLDADGQPVCVMSFEDVSELRAAERVKEESLALLDTIFESAPVGLAFFDRDLRYVRVNEALAEINGLPVEAHVGRTVPELLPDMDPKVVEGFRRVIETGEPLVNVEIRGETPAQPGRRRTWLCGWYPVRHPASSEVLGLGAVVTEITERVALLESERRARERAQLAERKTAFLAEVGEVLASSLDHEENLARVVRIAVPAKADWCAADVLGARGTVRRLALAHVDPDRERIGWELEQRRPARLDDRFGPGAVIRSGQQEMLADVSEEELRELADDDEHLRLLSALGLSSVMTVPLIVRRRAMGSLTFALADSSRRYGPEDLALAREVARRASIAIEHAVLYRERSHIAQTLQRSLLPPRLPEIPGFELAARYRAAGEGYDVGGDFYDAFETRDGGWALVVGDVCGKGPEAASLTSLARYALRTGAVVEHRPSRVLAVTNEAILGERHDDRFLTAVYVHLDPTTAELWTTNAGHPPLLVVRATGEVTQVGAHGPVLGALPEPAYPDEQVHLEPGDALVAYTDGVLDAGAPERLLAPRELARIAGAHAGRSAAELADAIERGALDAATAAPRDDIAVLVLRRV